MIVGRLARSEPDYDLPFLREAITNTDVGAAQAVYRLLSDAKRKTFQTEGDQQLLSSDSPQFVLDSREAFQTWITRVRQGPSEPGALDLSPELIDEVTLSRRPSRAPESSHPHPVGRFPARRHTSRCHSRMVTENSSTGVWAIYVRTSTRCPGTGMSWVFYPPGKDRRP